MAESWRKIDIVKFDEKALWRLHEKLKKIKAKENENSEEKLKKEPEKRAAKPSKFQVYQPGVTRLSNRKLAANFDRSTLDDSEKKTPVQKKENEASKTKTEGGEPRNTNSQSSRRSNARGRRGNSRLGYNERHKAGECEGYLARQIRKLRDAGEVSDEEGDKFEHDDELVWDNFESGLVHEGWSPQVTGTETSSQEEGELSDQELYKELSFDDEDGAKDGEHREAKINHPQQPSDDDFDEPSGATSGSNKDYYRVTHSISSGSDDGIEDEDYQFDDDREYGEEDTGDSPDSKPRKPQLYDPSNPEQPIMVKGQQSRGRGYNIPSPDNNVYNPHASRDRMMSKVMPSQPRRYKRSPRQNSLPRYYGNYYRDDEGHQDYEPRSPVTKNYSYAAAENLSEDEDTMISQSRSKRSHARMTMLNEAERYELTLSNLLSSPSFDSHEYTESLSRVRNKLKVLYERLIVNDIESATNENIEQKLWRSVYYQVIEILREQIRSCPEQDSTDLRDNLILLLDQGTAFYESLLENLQGKNGFNLKEILNSASARKRHRARAGKRSNLAILSCQRVFICLGDIARYREQACHSTNYGRARHCYLQAQVLAPKNGRPYNQLAILAVKTRHKLDAVYYYVRSLVASNPILSARESLMAIFDEIRRKLDYLEHKKEEAAAVKAVKNLKVNDRSKSRSNVDESQVKRWEEVWILPDSDHVKKDMVKKQTSVEDVSELKLPPNERMKHFILLFLNLHGKLFTRIGLELFQMIFIKTLKLYESLLLTPQTSHKLLQLYAVNLFAVFNADKLSIHGSAHDASQNQRLALRLSFSMFTITVKRVVSVFQSVQESPLLCEDLVTLLPSVKIMFDWMYANKNCWYSPDQDLTEPELNIWDALAELCNWVFNNSSATPMIRIYNEMIDGLHEVFLPEDVQLTGFSPLGQAFSDPRYVENEMITPENKTYIQQCVRISLIKDFLEYLCGMEEPLLAFKQGKYVSVAPLRTRSWSDKPSHDDGFMISDYDIEEPSENDRFQHSVEASGDGELSELRKYRDSLQVKKDLHARRQDQMKSSLEAEERIKLEIRPKYLVPDTNCFIDHLHLLEKLMKIGKFKISTPLVVISELEGLATEKKSQTAHAENVHQSAKKAVAFIENCMKTNNQRFCALTKRGTELQNLRFRSEDTKLTGSNDDFILESTHAYAKSHSQTQNFSGNSEKVVQCTVVLLTDDRNLRLKALLKQDLATKNVLDFARWVGI